MTDTLKSFAFFAKPESAQLLLRFQLHETPQQVEFLMPAHAMTTLIQKLQQVQEQYKLARDQYIQDRRKQIHEIVEKDDDV